jgi:hypothetical protein
VKVELTKARKWLLIGIGVLWLISTFEIFNQMLLRTDTEQVLWSAREHNDSRASELETEMMRLDVSLFVCKMLSLIVYPIVFVSVVQFEKLKRWIGRKDDQLH